MPDSPRGEVAVPLRAYERDEVLMQVREDVAVIRTHVENLRGEAGDHEARLRKLERRIWGVPGSLMVALLAALGVHLN